MSSDPHSLTETRVVTSHGAPPVRELLWYWGSVVGWMWVIATLSSDAFSATNTNRFIDPVLRFLFPRISVPEILFAHTVIRKSAHFTEFFVLGVLVFWASRRGRRPAWRPRWMVQALLVAGLYALLDEWHQSFVATRTATLADSGVDFLGAVSSQVALYFARAQRPGDAT